MSDPTNDAEQNTGSPDVMPELEVRASDDAPEPKGPKPGDFTLDLSGDLLSEALDAVEKRLYSKKNEPVAEEIEFELELPEISDPEDAPRPSSVEMKLVARIEALQGELDEARQKTRATQDEHKLSLMKANRATSSLEALKLQLQDARDNTLSNEQLAADLRGALKDVNEEVRRLKERQKREIIEVQHKTADRICNEFIPVMDNLDRATTHVPDEFEDSQFVQGLLMTLGQLEGALTQSGLERVTTQEGDKFDPEKHEAIAKVSNASIPHGCIVEVLQDGFTLKGRMLRPARVSVNAAEELQSQLGEEE